jgi:hypothetical protein
MILSCRLEEVKQFGGFVDLHVTCNSINYFMNKAFAEPNSGVAKKLNIDMF